jgi:hypothetical protein
MPKGLRVQLPSLAGLSARELKPTRALPLGRRSEGGRPSEEPPIGGGGEGTPFPRRFVSKGVEADPSAALGQKKRGRPALGGAADRRRGRGNSLPSQVCQQGS